MDQAKNLPMEGNPLVSPIALYLVLLSSAIAIAMITQDPVQTILGAGAAHTLLVLVWVLASQGIGGERGFFINPIYFLFAVGGSLLTFGLAMVMIVGVVPLLGVPATSLSEPFLAAGYGWPVIFLMLCVQPAIIEELAFRGIILTNSRKVMPDRDAIIVSSFLFAVLHLSPFNFPHTILMGLIAGWIRVRSGSILPGVVLHFIHNSLVILREAALAG